MIILLIFSCFPYRRYCENEPEMKIRSRQAYEQWYMKSTFCKAMTGKAFVKACITKHKADVSRYLLEMSHKKKKKRAAIVDHIARHNIQWRWPGYKCVGDDDLSDDEPQYFVKRIQDRHEELIKEGQIEIIEDTAGVPACPALLRKVNSQMLITNKAVSDEEAQQDIEMSSDKEETSSEVKVKKKPTKQDKVQSKKAVEAEKRRQKESEQVKRYTKISQTCNTHILT